MSSLSPVDLDAIYDFALRLGKDAGGLLQAGMMARCSGDSSSTDHVEKESAVDLVTQTDEGK